MKNRLKFFFCLFAVGFLCVACSTRPAEPSKPVPVVQVTTKEVATPPAPSKTPPATVPVADKKPKASATDTASTPAKKEEANATKVPASKKNPAKAQKSDVPAAPKAPLKKEEKKDVPATEKQPESSVSEKVETPVSPAPTPETKSIKFRCTFWMKPQKSYDIYVRTKGEFHRCQLFELVFSQEMTPDVDEKGMVTVYRKTNGDFVPLFTIDTCGIDNLGAILLPKFNPEDPQGAYIQVLDLDEKKIPERLLARFELGSQRSHRGRAFPTLRHATSVHAQVRRILLFRSDFQKPGNLRISLFRSGKSLSHDFQLGTQPL